MNKNAQTLNMLLGLDGSPKVPKAPKAKNKSSIKGKKPNLTKEKKKKGDKPC